MKKFHFLVTLELRFSYVRQWLSYRILFEVSIVASFFLFFFFVIQGFKFFKPILVSSFLICGLYQYYSEQRMCKSLL